MSANEMRMQKLFREESDTRRLGIKVKYMCLSLPCKYHQSMHGELFEVGQVKEIYDLSNVLTDCRCTVVQVLVDDLGNPLTPSIVEKAKAQKVSKKL